MRSNKFLALVLSFLLLLSFYPTKSLAFSDTRGHWAKAYIDELSSDGLVKGYNDGSFKPDNNMTRVEFYTLINQLAGFEKTYTVSFTDVNSSSWYYNEVAKAVKAGYLKPTTGKLNPNRNITREEVMEIVAKVYMLRPDTKQTDNFTDKARIDPARRGYVGALVKDGIVDGYPSGRIEPKKSITRAEVARIIISAKKAYGNTKLTPLADSQIIFGPRNLYE